LAVQHQGMSHRLVVADAATRAGTTAAACGGHHHGRGGGGGGGGGSRVVRVAALAFGCASATAAAAAFAATHGWLLLDACVCLSEGQVTTTRQSLSVAICVHVKMRE